MTHAVPPRLADRVFPGAGEMAALCRAHNWAATPLGPTDRWPESLRTAAQLVLESPLPNVLLWGPALVQVYNDGYRALMGEKHPAGLGQPARECWPEAWPTSAPVYERVLRGESLTLEDALSPVAPEAAGGRAAPQDARFTLSCSPVRDEAGAVAGVLVTVFETTARLRAEPALRGSDAHQGFLLGLSDALRPLGAPRAIQAAATRLLRERFDAGWCYYVEWDETLTAGTVLQDATREGLPSLAGRHEVSDIPEYFDFLRSHPTFTVPDYTTFEPLTPAIRERYTPLGFRSMLGASLVKDGQPVATLLLADTRRREWPETAVELARETAERTWAAVERARAEAALRESEERRLLAVEAAGIGDWTFHVETGLLDCSPRARAMHGVGPDEPITAELHERLIHPEDRPAVRAARARALDPASGGAYRVEFRFHPVGGGEMRWIESVGRGVFEETPDGPRAVRIVGAMLDVTDRRRAEAERERLAVAEAIATERQALLKRIVTAQEEERRRVAHEVHDGLTQVAHAAALHLDEAAEALEVLPDAPERAERMERARAELERGRELARRAAVEARRLIAGLRPEVLDVLGLAEALRQEVETLQEEGWRATFEQGGTPCRRLAPDQEITLYRVAQEALANVRKHAGRARVRVRLVERDGNARLEVRDWGRGFDPAAVRPGPGGERVGLAGMRERMALLGGHLEVRSGPEHGTTLRALLPLDYAPGGAAGDGAAPGTAA